MKTIQTIDDFLSGRGIASSVVNKFDVSAMHKSAREEASMPDDARGSIQIWRVEDYELVDWPNDRYGIFFQGDSYVILYTYGKSRHIIYYWLVSLKRTTYRRANSLIRYIDMQWRSSTTGDPW